MARKKLYNVETKQEEPSSHLTAFKEACPPDHHGDASAVANTEKPLPSISPAIPADGITRHLPLILGGIILLYIMSS